MSEGTFSPWPSFTEEEVSAVSAVLLSNKVNYWTGSVCREFEREFASFVGVEHAVAVSNGTVALDLALKALGVGPGDEVIVTPRTFLASVSCIVNAGAKPIFADVDADSQNITVASISAVLSPRTKAIICVHLAGWPCDMDPIMDMAKGLNLYVIEDCAQAHGGRYKGRSLGSIGHIGCWSFCQDKIMTTGGEGGMVTTNDPDLWAAMWSYKDHGKSWEAVYDRDHPPGCRWLHESFGTNWRMMETQAAIGRIQLRRMPSWSQERNKNLSAVWATARRCDGLRVPDLKCEDCTGCDSSVGCFHAGYKCYVFIEQKKLSEDWSRDRIISAINERGVPCLSGSCPEVYLEKAFDNTTFRPKAPLARANELGKTSLMFLVHPTLTDSEIRQTCEVLAEVMSQATRSD